MCQTYLLVTNIGCADGERKEDEGEDGFPDFNFEGRDNGNDEVEPHIGPDRPRMEHKSML